MEPLSTIRCTNCGREFVDDEDLILMQDTDGDWMHACPDCETDEHLMDLEDDSHE
jgi:hypothetical protein